MPHSLKCPSCGAPLDYEKGDDPTLKCEYCGSAIAVEKPVSITPGPIEPEASRRSGGGRTGWLVVLLILISIMIVVGLNLPQTQAFIESFSALPSQTEPAESNGRM